MSLSRAAEHPCPQLPGETAGAASGGICNEKRNERRKMPFGLILVWFSPESTLKNRRKLVKEVVF